MKIGLLADIHGNAAALRACLAAAKRVGVTRMLIAGDLVGYYYAPHEVMDELDRFDWVAVRGNHEDMLGAWCRGQGRGMVRRRYGSGLAAAMDVLDETKLGRLLDLPVSRRLEIEGATILLCHGTPASAERYVYPDAPDSAFEAFRVGGAQLAVYGHTHYPHLRDMGDLRIINPGSVGQPRNRVPGAHWALWDTETGTIQPRVDYYDPAPLIAECRVRDPHLPYLAEVLVRT